MRIFYSVLLFCCFSVVVHAQVVVRGEGKTGNPTVRFNGVSGDAVLTKEVLSALQHCGWFDVVSSGKSDFVVNGRAVSGSLLLDVANGAGVPMFTAKAMGRDPRALALTAVDGILQKEFNVPGICRTKIVFSAETRRNEREIYVCDFDGKNIKRLTANATLSVEPTWHPDGQSIIYNQYLLSSTPLVQFDLSRNCSRALSNHRGINSGRISPDGRRLALILTDKNQIDLYVRNINGGSLTRLTNDRAVEASPTWSPDGRYICYVSDKSGRPKLYIISSVGGTPRKVAGVLGSESVSPCWSKDNKLAYSARLGNYTLKVIDLADTMGFPPPANRSNSIIADSSCPEVPGESPSWAPDNRHVVISYRGSVYIVDTRTNKSRRLVSGRSACSGASWSPILK